MIFGVLLQVLPAIALEVGFACAVVLKLRAFPRTAILAIASAVVSVTARIASVVLPSLVMAGGYGYTDWLTTAFTVVGLVGLFGQACLWLAVFAERNTAPVEPSSWR